MKIKATIPQIKAMVFAGCSFTWGQGLWHYSGIDTLKDDNNGYNPGTHGIVHHAFREKWRWPTLVADHFGTVAITHYENGGANDQITEYWKACFEKQYPFRVRSFHSFRKPYDETTPIAYSEVSHFVFQFTQWWRSYFTIPNSDIPPASVQQLTMNQNPGRDAFYKWFVDTTEFKSQGNSSKIGVFHQWIMKRDLDAIKEFLMSLEENGIKTCVWSWPHEMVDLLNNDPWFKDRFIKFNYKDKTFNCLSDLIHQNNEDGLEIGTDYDFFEIPPNDQHPSMKCQKVIADNIIKFIEENDSL